MPIIKTVPPEVASGAVARVYDAMQAAIGFVPNGLQALSSSPHCLTAQADHIRYYMGHPTLPGPMLAAIRYLVAGHTDCAYCVGINLGMLMQMGIDRDALIAARADIELLPFAERDKAMVRLALQVVRDGHSLTGGDLDAVRALGWSDQEIIEVIDHATHAVALDMLLNAVQVEAEGM
ncbi:MAG: hypothetical protein GW824_01410 [Deltaproteobacteria bacterium]|nr:hypothetical protein [Deltaproteobacteria bacterium]